MKFKPVLAQPNFPELERRILKFWKKNRLFERSVKARPKNKIYSFYDGPPFITGLPHYGHLLGSIAKDLVPRYQTMKGKRVRRVWGWDCHGLPVEEKTERKLGLQNRRDIEKIGIDKFIAACREYVSKTSAEWEWYVDHVGRWVDFKNSYKTLDLDYMESVIWAFKQLYQKGLVYRGLRTLLYCTRCGTPVSKFEIAMDNSYAEVEDPALTIEFPITSKGKFTGARMLAWTTTPWTLPANRALAIEAKEKYVEFRISGKEKSYILAQKRIEHFFKKEDYHQIQEFQGKELLGLEYEPPYHYFPPNSNDFKIYSYPGMVKVEEGTGIVHSAPGFGEIDTEMGQQFGLTMMFAVDDEGKLVEAVQDFKGLYVKEADALIIKDLKERELLFREEIISHRYPYCYRCETPLIYRAVKAWFINIGKIKPEMLRLNKKVNWVPNYFKEGRVKNTIAEAPDWCVSRTRYFATVMPIWQCQDCQALKVVGSIKEIEKNSIKKVKVRDLHRSGVDQIQFKCVTCQGVMRRIPEVLDVWFESASMPYGERHYPFENKKEFEQSFPADYIVEYVGQIRAWFYYLHVLATVLKGSPAFKNVVVTGTMAGTDGRKMSKTYGNYPDPKDVLEKYGGDALRLYLMRSRLMMGRDINITQGEEIAEQIKTVLLPFWNCYKFFATFANLAGWSPSRKYRPSRNILDQWIVSRTNLFQAGVGKNFDEYHLPAGVDLIGGFLEDLSRWYIRRSRTRFRRGEGEALATLYWVLLKTTKAVAPVIPFLAEEFYQNLTRGREEKSVHLELWSSRGRVNRKLLEKMEWVRKVVSLGLVLRKEKGIKVRQPLSKFKIQNAKFKITEDELLDLIRDELNVKEVELVEEIGEEKGRVKAKEGELEVALETHITDELEKEGWVRETVRQIQALRKKAGYSPSDRILVRYFGEGELNRVLTQSAKSVLLETGAREFKLGKIKRVALDAEGNFSLGGYNLWLGIKKVNSWPKNS